MAYTTVNKSSSFQNQVLYTGNGSNGHAITGVGFSPSLVWLKNRSAGTAHVLVDAVRGNNKVLSSNNTEAEATTNANKDFRSFDSDGFTVDTNENYGSTNSNGANIAAWNWKAGTTSGLSGGTITPSSYSINSTSGFGIYKYTGTGSAGTIASGLPSVKCFIIKALDASSNGWVFYHQDLGTNKYLQLDTNSSVYTGTTQFNNTAPTTSSTNSLISVGTAGSSNYSGRDYIMYAFSQLQGYSKFGSYTGNGSTNGPFIYTGFKPAWLLIKRTSGNDNWILYDTKRETSNVMNLALIPDTADAEQDTSTYNTVDIISNGFKCRGGSSGAGTGTNQSGGSYIYMAFGQSIVGSNSIPATAR